MEYNSQSKVGQCVMDFSDLKRTNLYFLTTAHASSYKTETQLIICERRQYGAKVNLRSAS